MLSAPHQSLLEDSVSFAIEAVRRVPADRLLAPTPCQDWALLDLLVHATDSLSVIAECMRGARIHPEPVPVGDPRTVAPDFCDQAGVVLERLRRDGELSLADPVEIGDLPMCADVLAETIALEMAVHGWDVERACGLRRPIPAPLAAGLLDASRRVVTENLRPMLFGPAIAPRAGAGPGERLVAFLGRDPDQ